VARAWELVALLPMLSAALAVGLAGDGGVTASFSADPPRGEHHVDRAEDVLHAVAVMFNSASVKQKAGFRRPPPIGGLVQRLFADAGSFRGASRRPLANVLGDLLEPGRPPFNEVVVDPIVLDHQVQYAVEQRHVPARLDRQK